MSMKKLASMLLALVLVMALAAPAYADYHITLDSNSTDITGHPFKAYQIFTGMLDGKTLSDIQWGSGLTDAGKTAVLTALELTGVNAADSDSAAKASEALLYETDAKAVRAALMANIAANMQSGIAINNFPATLEKPGYYMFVDEYQAGDDETDFIIAASLLKVVGDVQIKQKNDKPTPDKNIVFPNGDPTKETSADIGKEINFEVTAKIVSMDEYINYEYEFADTMTAGLTLKPETIKVYANDAVVPEDSDNNDTGYTLTTDTNGFTVKLLMKENSVQKVPYSKEQYIKIKYTAVVNENAVTVNYNHVTLSYSNNPNNSDKGTSLPVENKVFTGKITGVKVDGDAYDTKNPAGTTEPTLDEVTPLADAKFVICKKVSAVEYFYSWDATNKKVNWVDAIENASEISSDDAGEFKFNGLADGTYCLRETKAPNGYNTLAGDVEFTVTQGETKTAVIVIHDNAVILNYAGAVLPETGGIGTTIFYAVGGLLVLAAVVLLVTKRRMGNQH